MDQRNVSGRPLAGSAWLETHHRAKLPERRAFCERLACLCPTRVVDLGCATGLWLEELDRALPASCEFLGLDSDDAALEEAARRAERWARSTEFLHVDLDSPTADIPEGDLTLIFSVSPYLSRLEALLTSFAERGGNVAVRQYDGGLIRLGPMAIEDRTVIDASLQAAVGPSAQFRHYDLDRVISAMETAGFKQREVGFESYERIAPFSPETAEYLEATLEWMLKNVSEPARERLEAWKRARVNESATLTYIVEVELVALLS